MGYRPRFALPLAVASLVVAASAAWSAPPAPSAKRLASPRGTLTLGDVKRMDINAIALQVGNSGSLPWDYFTGNAGLEFPKGSGKTAVFTSGLWLTATVAGGARATVTGYFDEFAPGGVVLGAADDPARPAHRVHVLDRTYPSPALRDAALADWNAGAVPFGAQGVAVLSDGSLDIAGDQMCWSVCNDLDAARHLSPSGSTAPLGVEVQQTTFAFDQPGALASTVFVRYRLVNRGNATLGDLHAGLWSDPDLGGTTDDLTGYDAARGMAFCYNATNTDIAYGAAVPAVGFDLIRGPHIPGSTAALPASAFVDFVNGDDPQSGAETSHVMHGLEVSGTALVDPTALTPTTFRHAGDPVTATGWLDSTPGDKRLLLTSGPAVLPPGGVLDVVFAIIVAQGSDRLNSVTLLRSYDDQVQAAYDAGTLVRLGAPPRPRGLALERPSPNPSRGTLTAACSLPDGEPATLELLDIAGRVVARQHARGAGRHVVPLTPVTPAPGLYLVRLTHGTHALTTRIVVIR